MKVIRHADEEVYLADDRGNPIHVPHLQRTTFEDFNGAVHTVHTHRQGPFQNPDEVIAAFYQGTLHTEPRVEEPDPASTDTSATTGDDYRGEDD